MQVANIARWDVHHVSPDDSLDKAISLMEEHRIRHLPVLEQGRPLGMISDRDILLAVGWRLEVDRAAHPGAASVGPTRVHEIMSIPAIRIAPDSSPDEAARTMIDGRIHALLLVQESALKGLVTSTDLLKHLADLPDQDLDRPISERMHVNLRAIARTAPLYQASRIIRDARIRHLPVLDSGELVGILTDRDLRRACGVDAIADEIAQETGDLYVTASKVEDIMSGPVETLSDSAKVRDAARLMATRRIGCVPVVRGGNLVGIITETDCLRLLAQRGFVDR
ncbi:MAG: CBS domain-containing protein [Phycisphaerales bacterium]|nr:CBS domain-containing protein [Phycisphaerales bacterium]MCB9854372.1 CBS domain-containing protein [Phycisphaerales bacterium]MCB9863573.1 CBS domain-containing protein [Phycisphaerales bacterium]